MMDQFQYPHPSYRSGGPIGRVVEVPVRFEGWNEPQSQQQERQQHFTAHNTNGSHPNQQSGTPPEPYNTQNEPLNQHFQSAPMPRKRGDVWEIPIQYIGQSSATPPSNQDPQHAYPQPSQSYQASPLVYPQPTHSYQQAPPVACPQYPPQASADYSTLRQPGGYSSQGQPESQPRGPVTIPIIRETCSSPNPARASPNPISGMQGSPRASPRPDFSQAVPPSAQQPQFQSHRQQEPTPDYNVASAPVQPSQPIPVPAPAPRQQEEDERSQHPPQPQKSQEERAFEIINGIMSEVKGLEEKVNNFKGVKKDKDYRFIEEMLTRSLLKLDTVESGSNENVRQARKQAVRYIEAAIDLLELKAVASGANYNPDNGSDPNQGPSGANTNNSTFNPLPTSGQTVATSSGTPQGQEASGKDPSRVKEMQLDSEIPC